MDQSRNLEPRERHSQCVIGWI